MFGSRRWRKTSYYAEACEEWAVELGYKKAVVESRDNKTEFYKQLGYVACGETVEGETFRCVRMEKMLFGDRT